MEFPMPTILTKSISRIASAPAQAERTPKVDYSNEQISITLVYHGLEIRWALPSTLKGLEQIVRNCFMLTPLAALSLRIPTKYASPETSRRIVGSYIWLASDESYQLAIKGAVSSRVEIFTDAYPPPDEPPLAELPGVEDALSSLLPRLSHLDLTRYVWYESSSVRGHGGYCDVFAGHLSTMYCRTRRNSGRSTIEVAIKRLRVHLGKDKSFAKTLAREIAVWSKLDHNNILPFLGYLLEDEYPSLVAEWMDNGTVREFLRKKPDCDITLLALGIARGLDYLHGQDIVHSDLKADNVLISQSGEPLICDFGISRMLNSSQTLFISTTHKGDVKGTTRWMAIELHMSSDENEPKHSKETDVWAYGMTLYEMITKEVPYAHIKHDIHVLLAIIQGKLPNKPPAIDAESAFLPLWEICSSCWETVPINRIPIVECVLRLEHEIQMRQRITDNGEV